MGAYTALNVNLIMSASVIIFSTFEVDIARAGKLDAASTDSIGASCAVLSHAAIESNGCKDLVQAIPSVFAQQDPQVLLDYTKTANAPKNTGFGSDPYWPRVIEQRRAMVDQVREYLKFKHEGAAKVAATQNNAPADQSALEAQQAVATLTTVAKEYNDQLVQRALDSKKKMDDAVGVIADLRNQMVNSSKSALTTGSSQAQVNEVYSAAAAPLARAANFFTNEVQTIQKVQQPALARTVAAATDNQSSLGTLLKVGETLLGAAPASGSTSGNLSSGTNYNSQQSTPNPSMSGLNLADGASQAASAGGSALTAADGTKSTGTVASDSGSASLASGAPQSLKSKRDELEQKLNKRIAELQKEGKDASQLTDLRDKFQALREKEEGATGASATAGAAWEGGGSAKKSFSFTGPKKDSEPELKDIINNLVNEDRAPASTQDDMKNLMAGVLPPDSDSLFDRVGNCVRRLRGN